MPTKSVINAENLVLGRLATRVARRLLSGDTIVVVNAEKALVTGSREAILRNYRFKREVGTSRKGPFFPRTPEGILKRTVRGMLPYDRPKGREAFRRLRVFVGIPEEYSRSNLESVKEARTRAFRVMTLGEISRLLGHEVRA